jgi:hypothetical protein
MKRFNLQDALAGKPVVTRNGTPAEVFQDKEGDLFVVVKNRVVDKQVFQITKTGRFYDDGNESPLDILMASEKRTIWLNLYENTTSPKLGYIASGFISELTAKNYAREDATAIAIPVEVEI